MTSTAESSSRWRGVGDFVAPRRISGIYLWIALIIFFSLTTDTFFTSTTARTIASQQAITAIVAIGLTIPLAAGVFDVSIGGIIGVSNIVVAQLMVESGYTPVVAVLVTIAVGLAIGLINGILVAKVRIDSFIATLAMNSILIAMVSLISSGENILGVPKSFTNVANNELLTIPLPVFYMLALALVVWYVLTWTFVGRRLYATGGGSEVARLAGVRTDAYVIGAFMASGAIAAAAGCLIVSSLGTGSTLVGQSYLLPVFAAGFLGATQFRPGRFNVWGSVLAVYLLATGVQGLILSGAAEWVPDAFNGAALIVAVGLSGFAGRARSRRAAAREAEANAAYVAEKAAVDAAPTKVGNA